MAGNHVQDAQDALHASICQLLPATRDTFPATSSSYLLWSLAGAVLRLVRCLLVPVHVHQPTSDAHLVSTHLGNRSQAVRVLVELDHEAVQILLSPVR